MFLSETSTVSSVSCHLILHLTNLRPSKHYEKSKRMRHTTSAGCSLVLVKFWNIPLNMSEISTLGGAPPVTSENMIKNKNTKMNFTCIISNVT